MLVMELHERPHGSALDATVSTHLYCPKFLQDVSFMNRLMFNCSHFY